MRRLLKTILLLPIGFALVVFAVANRHLVKVSLDPFGGVESGNLITSAPLFVMLIAAGMLGVLFGGAISWFTHGTYRKSARLAKVENERLKSEAARVKSQAAGAQ